MTKLALLIKNDDNLVHALSEQLKLMGDVVLCASLSEVQNQKPDVVIVSTPFQENMNEFNRGEGVKPLLFVLNMGATEKAPNPDQDPEVIITETFSTPFRLGHILARLQLHLSAQRQASDLEYQLGQYKFYPSRRQIVPFEGEALRLTEKESALLAFLAQSKEPVSRDILLAEIWGYDGRIDTHTLETHVYRLRSMADFKDLILLKQGFYELNREVFADKS